MQLPNRHRAAVALVAALGLLVSAAPAMALSADAQKIIDRVKADTPDLKPVCSDRGKLTTAVTSAVIALATAGQITSDKTQARVIGTEAGRYLYFHCS